jgi:GNAT superfamily N-acetyltransferase
VARPEDPRLSAAEIRLRRGTPDDTRLVFDLSIAAMRDLFARQGIAWDLDTEPFWMQLESYLRHLAVHAAEWWVAEDASDGSLVGYARSVQRGALIELSELFVRPDRQSAGVGRTLIEHALPPGRGNVRVIIATTDVRALARYYRAGTVVRFPIASLAASPLPTSTPSLEATRVSRADIPELAAIEEQVVGYPRHADYPWLVEQREGYLYRRRGRAVGFAFISAGGQGPFAALEPPDQVAILLHAETRAHALGLESVSFDVPMINEVAMGHLLGRGFRIDPPLTLLMSSAEFGHFDRFIPFGPGIVL